jgi:hypothetical protein
MRYFSWQPPAIILANVAERDFALQLEHGVLVFGVLALQTAERPQLV